MIAVSNISARQRTLLRGVCAAAFALALAGCSTNKPDRMSTGSIPAVSHSYDQMNMEQLRQAEASTGKAYAANPKDRNTGLNYANLLMMTGKNSQALAVMQQVAIAYPSDREVLASYGKAQAAAGQLEQALNTINRAQTPDRPDWRLYSAEGAVLDQLGRSSEARAKYRQALDLKPNDPTILSNLGMSYVLQSDPRTAETYMRSAASQPGADSRIRQNLALVVGLQGRFEEAERIAMQELSAQQAQANLTYLRSMLSQQNAWSQLSDKNKKTAAN
ncbi:tetratricopeptide repeat protein [Agrobacterium rosae]|uniref:tetratricopeptide repeat protein n=1 Tax=Agrobacterium rosae TaxID=1972867 RepID=UPI0019D3C20D|nr:tetratricopeptide repeat protein [Agrobacterium rosae]MBN7807523.1 tetratricopeptide repeat protein [Agrobacterium rosae]